MKAKDYFDKYEVAMVAYGGKNALDVTMDILKEMSQEVEVIYKARGCKTNAALAGILKELNNKWNAICSLFEKKYGASPMKRNGFIEFWKHEMPEIELIL